MSCILDKNIIFQSIVDHKRQLMDHGVTQMGLFGSFVSDMANEDSDMYLLVDIKKEKKTFQNFMKLSYYFEALFGHKVHLLRYSR